MQPATATTLPARPTRAATLTVGRVAVVALGAAMLAVAALAVAHRSSGVSDGATLAAAEPWGSAGLVVTPLPERSGRLQAGDVVTAIEGQELDVWLTALLNPFAPGPALADGQALARAASLTYAIERGGARLEVDVLLIRFPVGAVLVEGWAILVLVTTFLLLGAAVWLRRPDESGALPLFVLGAAMFGSTVAWLLGIGVVDVVERTGFWLFFGGAVTVYSIFWGALLHLALTFPAPMRVLRRLPWLVAAAYALPFAIQLGATVAGVLATDRTVERFAAWSSGLLLMQAVVAVGAGAIVVINYRQSTAETRARVRWVAVAAVVGALGGALIWQGPELLIGQPLLPWNAVALVGLPFPVALAAAIYRHRLFEMDALVNRSLVYGGLSLVVLLAYAFAVSVLGALVPLETPYAVTLLAVALAAVVALPLRDRLQRGVNRLMYGDRDDPYRAIATLGARLATSLDPAAVLPTVVGTVAQALRLPYAAIVLDTAEGPLEAAVHGAARGGPLLRLPLVHQGEEVGELVLAPRVADEGFSAADQRLLDDLARQAGAAAYAVRLTDELQRSRERLVTAREEERRRLRRDLHDELGPTLAGSLLKIEAARSLLETDAGAAGRLLAELTDETHRSVDEVRRLARELRPPALDELGLVDALREQAERLTLGPDRGLHVELGAPAELPPLSAAVEVAAYRIATEALSNVVRHADARRATLRLSADGSRLTVEVEDDGRGVTGGQRAGVGWTSMRERAAELGGTCEIGPRAAGGTRVSAHLPMQAGGS